MAQFLPKEHFNVQSSLSHQPSGSSLAGDLLGILGSVGKMKQDSMALMAKESEEIGGRVAVDKLLNYNYLINEEKKLRIEQGNKHDFNGSIERIDSYVGSTLAEVKDKFGEDSKAYKSFEDSFLQRATGLQQQNNLAFFEDGINVANENTRNMVLGIINEGINALGSKHLDDEYTIFANANGKPEYFSQYTVSTSLAQAQNNNVDFRRAFNKDGSLNQGTLAKIVEENFGNIVSFNKDGSITKKHEWLQESDVASIKKFIDTNVDGLRRKQGSNFELKRTIMDRGDVLTKFSPTGDYLKDIDALNSMLNDVEKVLFSVPTPNETDIESAQLFTDKVGRKADEIFTAYSIAENSDQRAEYARSGSVTVTKGGVSVSVSPSEKDYKAIINSKYDSYLDIEGNDADSQIKKQIGMREIVKLEKETGINSSTLDTVFVNYNSGRLTVDSAKKAIETHLALVNEGRQPVSGSVFLKENLEGARYILNEEGISDTEKLRKLSTYNANIKSTEYIKQGENYKKARSTVNKIFKDTSTFEEIAQSGSFTKFTKASLVKLNESMNGGITNLSEQVLLMMADNGLLSEVDVNDAGAITDVLTNYMSGQREFSYLGLGREYMPPLQTVDASGNLRSDIVDADILLLYAKEKLGVEGLKRENLRYDYYYNSSMKRMELSVYARIDGVGRKDLINQLSGDFYKENISTAERRAVVKGKREDKEINDRFNEVIGSKTGGLLDREITSSDIIF